MKAGVLTASLAVTAVVTVIALWPIHEHRTAAPAHSAPANTGWSNAGMANFPPALVQQPERNLESAEANPVSLTAGDANDAPAYRAVVMQDGTVIEVAARTRTGAAPARER